VQITLADNGAWLTVNAVGADADPVAVEARLAEEHDRLSGLATTGDRPPRPGIAATRRTTSREAWRESVEAAVDRIRGGDLQKVVLAQALEADLAAPFPRAATLDRLAEKYRDCHRYYFEPDAGGSAFFGATPERLVALRGRTVETDALARGRPAAGRRRRKTSGSRRSCSTTRKTSTNTSSSPTPSANSWSRSRPPSPQAASVASAGSPRSNTFTPRSRPS